MTTCPACEANIATLHERETPIQRHDRYALGVGEALELRLDLDYETEALRNAAVDSVEAAWSALACCILVDKLQAADDPWANDL
ncbi:hypothetical protein [Streptomyces albireticuli]|uniref:Uncharacterized protein n=1 Tax=Streptomyces albireticuli TaxID=1940 RepID=A0A2A2D1K6_9ACTN|nr:hypothetical protein [Streptomyces albireticuli]MCD9145924.1 hypothetical protein [Streptomyces albireticuli]MCD9166094.1 hypothetical protein [Streptomyces albireticuli]MCD9196374.1 hypothetical protein [Streptomyces albireticuli]PAU45299.1 hypothetical protein CK936_30260 [Streptomyces albireticuli]